jgi:Uma2 family endonuclease
MSTIRNLRTPPKTDAAEADPFRYGWRFVHRKQPDGTLVQEQVPLTLEDLLFPEEGDFIVQTVGHNQDCAYLMDVFRARLAGDPSAVVISDCRVAWDVPGLRPLGPDVAVFFGLHGYEDWGTLDVAKEGAIPALVVEVTSPETRKNDVGIKKEFYHRARVPQYVIVDVRSRKDGRQLRLTSFRHTPGGYERIPPDDRGWVWLDSIGVWLGSAEGRAVCYDGETAAEIGDYTSVCQALAAAEERAAADARARALAEERAAADARALSASEARNRELEEELRRLRGGPS